MLLFKLSYFAFATTLFLVASYPFFAEMRNGESFYANLLKVQKEKRKGSNFLALAFWHFMLTFCLFVFLPNDG